MAKMRISSLHKTNISFEMALEEFIELIQAKGRSLTTVNDYQWHCTRFHSLYPHFPNVDQMKQGAAVYLNAKISPYTYNLRLTYNKCFFRYCVEQGYLSENPMQLFKVKKTEPRIVQHSSEVLIELLWRLGRDSCKMELLSEYRPWLSTQLKRRSRLNIEIRHCLD